jgi:malate dehydrogenase (oxaloacetate-decarboxylating)(NADP+)
MFDSKGLIHPDRDNLDGKKQEFANGTAPASTTLADALVGADVFIGLSRGNTLKKEMLASMGADCIVFAMANPTPEISYEEATSTRTDLILRQGAVIIPTKLITY